MAFDLANPIGTGTDQELLEFTRAAIAQITLHGQSYTIGNRTFTRADLPELREQVEWLEARIARSSGDNRQNYVTRRRAL
jgi:hypothetical protein